MKKMFFALMCVASLGLFSACSSKNGAVDVTTVNLDELDDTTPKCWETKASYAGQSSTQYMWGTEKTVVWACQQGAVAGVKWTYKAASAEDVDSCEGLND